MKKIKTTLLLLFLGLPFLATAQWSVQVFAGGGTAFETAHQEKQNTYFRIKNSKTTDGAVGYTLQGGISVQYLINGRFGFGTGLGYQYSKTSGPVIYTTPNGTLPDWHAESLKVPFNFLWSPGKHHHSVFNAGLATHFNLMSYETYGGVSNDQYPVYASAQLGYAYKLGKRFQAGILLETDLGWYARTASYMSTTTTFANRSFTSAQIILSYRLFGKDGKKR